jgi:hypothetical protein
MFRFRADRVRPILVVKNKATKKLLTRKKQYIKLTSEIMIFYDIYNKQLIQFVF